MGTEKEHDKMMADVVASIVEKILMEEGLQKYNKVSEILTDYEIVFTDCYKRPDVLNFALKQVFEDGYTIILEKIRQEFTGLSDEHHELARFLEKLGE